MTTTADRQECIRFQSLGQAYLGLLLEGRRHEAGKMVLDEVGQGLAVSSVYVDVLQPVMYELGRMWQRDEIDIATEHYVTAATQVLIAQLFPHALASARVARSMVGCCLGSELHELGMRMVCDFFEFAGWDTYFLGAVTPAQSLITTVTAQRPDLVCISATMSFGLPKIRSLIQELRTGSSPNPPRIMVGGLPFLINPELFRIVGADATAADARQAVHVATQLMTRGQTHATQS